MKSVKEKVSQESQSDSDRISYSEGVKINIGDYESRDVHISFSTAVKDNEQPQESIQRARSVVREELRKYEKRIRVASQDDVDFESSERLNYYNKK